MIPPYELKEIQYRIREEWRKAARSAQSVDEVIELARGVEPDDPHRLDLLGFGARRILELEREESPAEDELPTPPAPGASLEMRTEFLRREAEILDRRVASLGDMSEILDEERNALVTEDSMARLEDHEQGFDGPGPGRGPMRALTEDFDAHEGGGV